MVESTSVEKGTQVMVVFEETAPPLSELDIARVEHRLGIHLPQDLKAHYLVHNGGRPRPGFFHKDGDAYGVGEFLTMNTDNPDNRASSFEWVYILLVHKTPEFPRGYIPFADDDGGGDLFLYSVRPDSFGNIMFYQHEYYGDDDRYVVFLAPSLREFINSLAELDAS
jgi:cell wall assembly regulator SMI1